MSAVCQADSIKQVLYPFARAARLAAEFRGKKHIFFRRQRGNKLIGLKDETDFSASHSREFIFAQILNFKTIDDNAPPRSRCRDRQAARAECFCRFRMRP